MNVKIANNAESTLAAPVASTDLVLNIQAGDATKFPVLGVDDVFYVTLERKNTGQKEIVLCTGRVGSVLTVLRAQEGTPALSFIAGDIVSLRFTKAALDGYIAQQVALSGGSGMPGVVVVDRTAGDGIAIATAAWREALSLVPSHGGVVFCPDGDYLLDDYLRPNPNTIVRLSGGARLIFMSSAANLGFAIGPPVVPSTITSLTTGLAGATQIAVASTAALLANDRVIVSGGTFNLSGVEEGPIEFNTVVSVDDATHLTLASPLKYSYSALGMTAALPVVRRLGPVESNYRNIKILGGRMCAKNASQTVIMIGCNYVENVEVSGVTFEDDPAAGYVAIGTGIMNGGKISRLNFHKNIIRGKAGTSGVAGENVGINVACLVESKISRNNFGITNEDNSASVRSWNHLLLEVGCVDNDIDGNTFFPVRTTNAAVQISENSFANRIRGNRIIGVPTDFEGSLSTIGIRTDENSDASIFSTMPGNVIEGNTISDVMFPIIDSMATSAINGNVMHNRSLHASSIGITVGHGLPSYPFVGNTFKNFAFKTRAFDGTIEGIVLDGGDGVPGEYAQNGSIFMRHDATVPGQSQYFREVNPTAGGAPVWNQRNQIPTTAFADLPSAVGLAWGIMFFVYDGTQGSNPLTGGGTGCVAVSHSDHWQST